MSENNGVLQGGEYRFVEKEEDQGVFDLPENAVIIDANSLVGGGFRVVYAYPVEDLDDETTEGENP